MFTTLARSVALGVFAAGALLGSSGIASAGPGDLAYCPPGYHTADDAIQIPGVPKGCEPSIPFVVPPAVIGDNDRQVKANVEAQDFLIWQPAINGKTVG